MNPEFELIDKVSKDLEKHGFTTVIWAYIINGRVRYTIFATQPSGRAWEIVKIVEE